MNTWLSTSTNEISKISEAQLLIQQDDQHTTPILKCFQSPGRTVIRITDFVLPRVQNIHCTARLSLFSREQPYNVLTLIPCASCAHTASPYRNELSLTVETVLWRARSALEALSWPHLLRNSPLSIHLGSRQSPADSTLQARCRPEIISALSLKLPSWTRDHTPPSHDFDGLGHSSVCWCLGQARIWQL